MSRREHIPSIAGERACGGRMTIKYPAKCRSQKPARRAVYIRYSTPPVTSAEIEIMRMHLETTTGIQGGAQNDNLKV
jgi:hypothetical protein